MSDLKFFDLSRPAPARLALMRAAFASHAQRYPHCPEHAKPRTWRDVRRYTLASYRAAFCAGLSAGFNGTEPHAVPVWYSHTGPNFRGEKFAHEVDGFDPRHTGWFTEHDGATYRDGSGLARGIVARLPHGRFIAGYWWGDNGERVYFPEVFTDETDAARMADEHARVFAEAQCADSARAAEARELETEREKKAAELCKAFALRNHARFASMREEVREIVASMRAIDARLSAEFSDYL